MNTIKGFVIELKDDLLMVTAIVATIVTTMSAICLLDDFISMIM